MQMLQVRTPIKSNVHSSSRDKVSLLSQDLNEQGSWMNVFCGSPWQVSMRGKQNKNISFCSGGGFIVAMLCSLQPWFVCLQMLETQAEAIQRSPEALEAELDAFQSLVLRRPD